jgi:phosphohistidine phosphatase SixA
MLMTIRNTVCDLAVLAAVVLAGCAPMTEPKGVGASDTSTSNLAEALRGGGHVIVFRHGATHADQADTDPLNPENISKQRQLNDSGRQLARDIGESFRAAHIPVGEVRTSNFHRAYETGMLAFGKATKSIDLTEGGLMVSPIENNRRAAALRKLAGTMPASGSNTVIVSHKPNIIDAFGKDWFDVKEGEASIFKVDPEGKFHVVARVQADQWGKVASTK